MKMMLSIALATCTAALPLLAQDREPLRDLTADGLALGGFDPVACFPAGGGAPAKGSTQFESKAGAARYRFASAEHQAWFQAEPARYEPAFGGFDATAMAGGERKSAESKQFKLLGARLFVFADAATAATFDAKLAARADEAWTKLSGEKPRGTSPEDALVGVKWNLGKSQLAIEGFDPVCYFPEGGSSPKAGEPKIETVLDGARYRFTSDAHRAWFLAEPARYRPKFGGWCAYAMADGNDVEVDPKSFLIENGRLLLFYKGFLADTRAKWLAKPGELGPKADAGWAKHAPAK
jgi:YHS domain-containing protein